MALTTPCQVILLSLFILADSYLFALDLFDGRDHHRIPLGLPNPFELYPGMFDPTVLPIMHKDDIRDRPHYRPPFTSEITTSRIGPKEKVDNVITTTEEPPPKTDESQEDISAQDPEIEREVFLMKNAKIPEVTDPRIEDEIRKVPEANSLSIHDDPKFSNNWSETTTSSIDSLNSSPENKQETNSTENSELSKNSEFLVIPVTAVNPALLNLPNSNTAAANIGLRDQNSSPTLVSLNNNVNTVSSNQPTSYVNVPLGNNNGASNNVYTIVTIPNNPNQPNNLYVQPNSPQVYNLVPLTNLLTGNSQPNTYAIINNQIVPINSQSFNAVPISNQNNLAPVNSQSNGFVSVNNQPINLIPISNPLNNLPSVNTQPNNLVPTNNQFNNFVPLNNQPINIIPVNNVPNNFIPANSNNQLNSYDSSNNNFIPVSSIPNNVVTLNNQPNYVSANLIPINSIPANNPPINSGITFGSLANDKSNTPNNNVPNAVVPLTPVGAVTYTRDKDEDESDSDKKDVEIKNQRDEE